MVLRRRNAEVPWGQRDPEAVAREVRAAFTARGIKVLDTNADMRLVRVYGTRGPLTYSLSFHFGWGDLALDVAEGGRLVRQVTAGATVADLRQAIARTLGPAINPRRSNPMRRYTYLLTYDTVTPESAEEGDFDDNGFGDPDGFSTSLRDIEEQVAKHHLSQAERQKLIEDAAKEATTEIDVENDPIDAAVAVLDAYGCHERSTSGKMTKNDWWSVQRSPDWQTAGETTLSIHFDGYTDAEMEQINQRWQARRKARRGW